MQIKNRNDNYITRFSEHFSRKNELIDLPSSIVKVSKSICKIETPFEKTSGFLIKFLKKEDFFCLMTNGHVIEKELIEQNNEIKFYYDVGNKCNKICLNINERFIRNFKDIGIDSTIIEILPKDNISKNYFLIANTDYMFNYDNLLNKDITVVQYTKGNCNYSSGKITDIEGNKFTHSASTNPGSSGSPIFLKDTTRVIGIQKSRRAFSKDNNGDFIIPIFNFLKKVTSNRIRAHKHIYTGFNKPNKNKIIPKMI